MQAGFRRRSAHGSYRWKVPLVLLGPVLGFLTSACAAPHPAAPADLSDGLPSLREIVYHPESRGEFAKYAVCQIQLRVGLDPISGLPRAADDSRLLEAVGHYLAAAAANEARVVIFPELTAALSDGGRADLVLLLERWTKQHDAIVVCGTYYDAARHAKVLVVTPEQVATADKVRPSRFEVSPLAERGMARGHEVAYLRTKFGNLLVIVCADLISDDVQFVLRSMANRGLLDAVVVVAANPATKEFVIEANSVVRRHPLAAVIANTSHSPMPNDEGKFTPWGDSCLLASLRKDERAAVMPDIPPAFLLNPAAKELHPAYNMLVRDVMPGDQRLLLFELNLRLARTPADTNAPDQGYPCVRDVSIVDVP